MKTKAQFVASRAAASRADTRPATITSALPAESGYSAYGKRAELYEAVKAEVRRQAVIREARRESQCWCYEFQSSHSDGRRYGYGRRLTVLEMAQAASVARKAEAGLLAGVRRKRETLAGYLAAAALRLASAVDLPSAVAAQKEELLALVAAVCVNSYGDFAGWADGVVLGYTAGPRHPCGVRSQTMDGWSGSGKWSKPIKHVIHLSSEALDKLDKLVNQFTEKPKFTFSKMPKAVRSECYGFSSGTCRSCDGDGTVMKRFGHGYDEHYGPVQCPKCGGAGELLPRKTKDTASETAALGVFRRGGSEAEMVDAARKAARLSREAVDPAEAVRVAAMNLGLRGDSTLAVALLRGEVSEDEAQRIAAKTVHRHENTDYDELLRSGMSRDDARAMASELV